MKLALTKRKECRMVSRALRERAFENTMLSRECTCSKHKFKGEAFCSECLARLPMVFRDGLNLAFTHGFEESYTKARNWLKIRKYDGRRCRAKEAENA